MRHKKSYKTKKHPIQFYNYFLTTRNSEFQWLFKKCTSILKLAILKTYKSI